jgi:cytochrome P450
MMEFLSEDMRRDPYPLYEQMRGASPVLNFPGTDMWLLFDYESVKRAITDSEAFSSSVTPPTGKAPDWMIFSDPPRHSNLRAIVMRAFTPKTISALEPRVRELSRRLLSRHLERGELDLVGDYSDLLPTLVIAEMLGIPSKDLATFQRWSGIIAKLSYALTGGEEALRGLAEHAAAKEEMRLYLTDLLAERRRSPQDDLLTRLSEAEVDGQRLSLEDILGFFQLLLLAGTETTTSTISNAMLCFLEYPEQLARLRREPQLLPSAIEEVIRFRSPTQFVFRESRREVELHGQRIPPGKMVLPMIGAANRDPSHFSEPERFDIARNPNPHIAFGHGIHFCLGAALARLEARVALSDLLEHFADFQRTSSEPWEPRQGLLVHGPARLPLHFTRRKAA